MEYLEKDEAIMRERVHDAKLVRNKSSEKIQFITECKFQEKKKKKKINNYSNSFFIYLFFFFLLQLRLQQFIV
jgi:hypothetical protein